MEASKQKIMMGEPIAAILCAAATPRLHYICATIFTQWLGLPYTIITQAHELEKYPVKLAYGLPHEHCIHIPASGLLDENYWHQKHQQPPTQLQNGMRVLFPDKEEKGMGFDLLSAVFWCITRYEEYHADALDHHHRFDAFESWAYKNECLHLPIADMWVQVLKEKIVAQSGIDILPTPFKVQLSYDIDIAWSYLYKGRKRALGAALKDLSQFNFSGIRARNQVKQQPETDPFYSFPFLKNLHRQYHVQPFYFLLCAQKVGAFDKNNQRENAQVQALFHDLNQEGNVGIHPSYHAGTTLTLLQNEINYLQQLLHKNIHYSRQHYIRLQWPHTYQNLISCGITDDYSLGYTTVNGFRAGTARDFYFFNIATNEATNLCLHPFMFMDTTAHFEQQQNTSDAFEKLYALTETVKQTGGTMTTIFHNFSLGTETQWRGWREAYAQYLAHYF